MDAGTHTDIFPLIVVPCDIDIKIKPTYLSESIVDVISQYYAQELNANRPPTPTRGRPPVVNDRGSLAWI
jgi:hypothetical protein